MFFFSLSLSLQQPLSSANFLYELDKITQDVLMVSVFLLSGASMSSSHQSNSTHEAEANKWFNKKTIRNY